MGTALSHSALHLWCPVESIGDSEGAPGSQYKTYNPLLGFSNSAMQGIHGCRGSSANKPGWGLGRTRTHTYLAGANGTFDEAKWGHNRVPAGTRASPGLVPIKVAAWERRKKWTHSQEGGMEATEAELPLQTVLIETHPRYCPVPAPALRPPALSSSLQGRRAWSGADAQRGT